MTLLFLVPPGYAVLLGFQGGEKAGGLSCLTQFHVLFSRCLRRPVGFVPAHLAAFRGAPSAGRGRGGLRDSGEGHCCRDGVQQLGSWRGARLSFFSSLLRHQG